MKHHAVSEVSVQVGDAVTRVNDLLIVDDHPLMCEALTMTLKIAFGMKQARCERSLAAAQQRLKCGKMPDAILLDLNLPDAKGSEGIVCLTRLAPRVPIAVISANEDPDMIAVIMAAGARGYISKSLGREAMCAALRRVWAGEKITPESYDPDHRTPGNSQADMAETAQHFSSLTLQQMKTLRLICKGKANKEISYELNIAEATVKTHITAIMSKIGARRRTQVVLLANSIKLFEEG